MGSEKDWDYSRVADIKIGETTRGQIYQWFGEPWNVVEQDLDMFEHPVEGWGYYHVKGKLLGTGQHSLSIYFSPVDRTVIAFKVKSERRGEKNVVVPNDGTFNFSSTALVSKKKVIWPIINDDGTVSDLSPSEERKKKHEEKCKALELETGIQIVDRAFIEENGCHLIKVIAASSGRSKKIKKAMKKGATHIVWTTPDLMAFEAYLCN